MTFQCIWFHWDIHTILQCMCEMIYLGQDTINVESIKQTAIKDHNESLVPATTLCIISQWYEIL